MKGYMIYLILFSKFSDVLPAFTCVSPIGNFWRICLGVNVLMQLVQFERRPLPVCCFLKSRILWTISTILFGFSFSGVSFLSKNLS